PARLYAAAALRIILRGALLLAAATSRAPSVLRLLGVVVLVAGVVTPFIGADRARALIDWWASRGSFVMRVWAGVAVVFGCFLVWVLLPKSLAATEAGRRGSTG